VCSGEHMFDTQARAGTFPQIRSELCHSVSCDCGTQLGMKVSMHMLASMLCRGTASTHLIDLSMMVNRFTWLSEETSRGPTRSTSKWKNLHVGTAMAWSRAACCLWTVPN